MADTTYTYAVSTDFPGAAVNSSKLHAEIQASAIVTALGGISNSGDVLGITFKDALSAGDKTLLDNDVATGSLAGGLIAAHDNSASPSTVQPVELKVADPFYPPPIALDAAPIIEQAHFVTHNFADKSSWYQNSVRTEGATATVDGTDAKIYHLDSPPSTTIINAHFGKINQEDIDPTVTIHKFKVYVDGVEKKVAELNADAYPTTTNWADYGYEVEVDWSNGDMKFKTDPSPGVVTADYSSLDNTISTTKQSEFHIFPPAGKKLKILRAETQFSKGVNLTDSCIFTGFGPLTFSAIQADATLDPGTQPLIGARYRLDDVSALHANFGTITHTAQGKVIPVGDGDVVEFDNQRGWGIIFDASAQGGTFKAQSTTTGAFYDWNGSAWSSGSPGFPTIVEAHGHRKVYKTLADYLNEATGNYPEVAANMVAGPRGNTQETLQIPWNWVGSKSLKSSQYAQMVMFLENGIPFTGTDAYVTATIYCQVFDD
jgi:hypothetical protein